MILVSTIDLFKKAGYPIYSRFCIKGKDELTL